MKRTVIFLCICVTALSAILPGCDQDEIPPYTGVVINGPEEPAPPAPPTAKDTADFMETASVEGTWQLVNLGYDSIDCRDSAIFYTFTVDESVWSGLNILYDLRQKGNLTIRRGDRVEESIPYEYFFVDYNNPVCYLVFADHDFVPNLQMGDSLLYCLRHFPGYMSLRSVDINPKYGNREYRKSGFDFSKAE
jgi:hypothetical protein